MSSSIFKDLAKEREIEERERDYEREMYEAEEPKRASSPISEIIYESEWYQGFGSECKEYLGIGHDNRFYYALEIGDQDQDLFWHGPYETRGEAEEQL